jgi:serine/threonine protein kinase
MSSYSTRSSADSAVSSVAALINNSSLVYENETTPVAFGAAVKAKLGHKDVIVKSIFEYPEENIDLFHVMDSFIIEAAKLRMLQHDCVVRFLGFVMRDFFSSVTELAGPLGNLEDYIKDNSAMPWSERASIARDIAEGMNYLHNKAISIDGLRFETIHHELHSENIILDMDIDTGKLRCKISGYAVAGKDKRNIGKKVFF